MHDEGVTSFDKVKKDGIKDIISGVLIIVLFGGALLFGIINKFFDYFLIAMASLIVVQGILLIAIGIYEHYLYRKYIVWNREQQELQLRKEAAVKKLQELNEEAEELNKLSQYGGDNSDTETNGTAN